MSWEIIGTIVGVIAPVLSFFLGRLTAAKSDGERDGAMLSKLDSIGSSIEKIDGRLENLEGQIGDQRDRITRLETRMEVYHHGGDSA